MGKYFIIMGFVILFFGIIGFGVAIFKLMLSPLERDLRIMDYKIRELEARINRHEKEIYGGVPAFPSDRIEKGSLS